MINLEKSKYEKCQSPPLSLLTHTYTHTFKRICLCTILPPPFFVIFQIPLSGGGNQNLLPPALKQGGRGPNYVIYNL